MRARFRAVFISDIHLGFHLARVSEFTRWLDQLDTECLYINGDFIDGWTGGGAKNLLNRFDSIAGTLRSKQEAGMKLLQIPGNHDDYLRKDPSSRFLDCAVADEFIHHSAAGKRLLVTHGDLFDGVERRHRFLSRLGGITFNSASRFLPPSISHWIKRFSKNLFGRPTRLTGLVAGHAASRKLDGIIMGHTHRPSLHRDNSGFLVANCGDWVEHASFVAETTTGDWILHDRGRETILPGEVAV